jgi:N-acetylglutamate synthase
MPEFQRFALCDLEAQDYPEVMVLWQQAGLHVRPQGRDSPEAFARQLAQGYQRVIGLRAVAANDMGMPEAEDGQAAYTEVAPESTKGPLVAVAVLTHDGRKGWINRLAVSPAYWHSGLARTLVAEAERWFTEDCGLEVWGALIESWNHASRSLFASLDYQPLDVVCVSKRTRPDA